MYKSGWYARWNKAGDNTAHTTIDGSSTRVPGAQHVNVATKWGENNCRVEKSTVPLENGVGCRQKVVITKQIKSGEELLLFSYGSRESDATALVVAPPDEVTFLQHRDQAVLYYSSRARSERYATVSMGALKLQLKAVPTEGEVVAAAAAVASAAVVAAGKERAAALERAAATW